MRVNNGMFIFSLAQMVQNWTFIEQRDSYRLWE